jgi:hypothetical protein
MRLSALILTVTLLSTIAGCAITRPGSVDVSQRPAIGMSPTQVRAMWGTPTHSSLDMVVGTLYQSYVYQRKQRVYRPYGHPRYYDRVDYYTVRFADGKVTGVSQ